MHLVGITEQLGHIFQLHDLDLGHRHHHAVVDELRQRGGRVPGAYVGNFAQAVQLARPEISGVHLSSDHTEWIQHESGAAIGQ